MAAPAAPAATAAPASEGIYLGASIGATKARPDGDFYRRDREQATDTSYKVFGGYQFNQYVAAEAQYIDLGRFTGNTTRLASNLFQTTEIKVMTLGAVGMFPLNDQFSLIGKLGLATIKNKYVVRTANGAIGPSVRPSGNRSYTNTTNLMWGLGAEYAFTPQLSLRAEYESFGKANMLLGNNRNERLSTSMLSMGLRYRF